MSRAVRSVSAAEVNALPEPLRSYIHDLETRCDPSGEFRELIQARDTISQLEEALRLAANEIVDLKERLKKAKLRTHVGWGSS